MDTVLIERLSKKFGDICGKNSVFTDKLTLDTYESDQTMNLQFSFDILVKPRTAEEISKILVICNKYKVPVTPRGGGSGVTGGALPVKRGLVISLELLNKIITINPIDGFVIAEAGVVTADLCKEVEKQDLYFPVSPTSSLYSFIGGNVAENAGSMTSCKYGTTSKYVLNLEVVLPTGEIIWTGANVMKNSTGLNLTQLFVGSEGTLGIVTKVVYRLIPIPGPEVTLLVGFQNLEDTYQAVLDIKQSGIIPLSVELIGQKSIEITAKYLAVNLPLVEPNVCTHLLITLQEPNLSLLTNSLELIAALLEKKVQSRNILVAQTRLEKEMLTKLRLNIGNALNSGRRKYRDVDICVPLSKLFDYIINVETVCQLYNVQVAYFGHAMEGNLHTMLIIDDELSLKNNEHGFKSALEEIYKHAITLGGVISGEHGIGLLQKEFMHLQFSNNILMLFRDIKKMFDPNGILNPGKVFE